MQQHHIRMLAVNPVELPPNDLVVVELLSPRKGNLRSNGHQRLGLCMVPGCDKIPAIDHQRGKRSAIGHRSGPRPPGQTGMALE